MSECIVTAVNRHVAGSNPAQGANDLNGESTETRRDDTAVDSRGGVRQVPPPNFDHKRTIAVVLGARNEFRLLKLERALQEAKILHSAIHETEGKYAGQLMAIGLYPDLKEVILEKLPYLNEFHMLQWVRS